MRQVIKSLCPVCKSNDHDYLIDYRGKNKLFINLRLVHCKVCNLVHVDPMPSVSNLEEYNITYFLNAHGGRPVDPFINAFFISIARLRIDYIKKYLKDKAISDLTVMEYGPAFGYFAHEWLSMYPKTTYFGCETDESCHSALSETGVQLISHSLINNTNTHYDLIVMSHVLEHIANPYEFLESTSKKLFAGGVIFIEVPCRDWEYKSNIEPHLLFFDKLSITYLLKKIGLDNIQVTYHGEEIECIKSQNILHTKVMQLRDKLIRHGVITPFARKKEGMEMLNNPIERAMIAPFKAHCESEKPSRWLRAIATKY